MKRLQRAAWVLVLVVDVGYIAWGAAAAASPDHLLGPGGKAILPAGYEGYSGGSWSEVVGALSPLRCPPGVRLMLVTTLARFRFSISLRNFRNS